MGGAIIPKLQLILPNFIIILPIKALLSVEHAPVDVTLIKLALRGEFMVPLIILEVPNVKAVSFALGVARGAAHGFARGVAPQLVSNVVITITTVNAAIITTAIINASIITTIPALIIIGVLQLMVIHQI